MDIGNNCISKESFQCNVGFASFSFFRLTSDIVDIKVCLPKKVQSVISGFVSLLHCEILMPESN